jgi:hypothetical protein
MAAQVVSLHFVDVFGSQCFPLRIHGDAHGDFGDGEDLFSSSSQIGGSGDGITDTGLKHFQDAYPGETI